MLLERSCQLRILRAGVEREITQLMRDQSIKKQAILDGLQRWSRLLFKSENIWTMRFYLLLAYGHVFWAVEQKQGSKA